MSAIQVGWREVAHGYCERPLSRAKSKRKVRSRPDPAEKQPRRSAPKPAIRGAELPETCRSYASGANVPELIGADIRSRLLNTASFIEIEDEHHQLLPTVPFEEVVRVTDDKPPHPYR